MSEGHWTALSLSLILENTIDRCSVNAQLLRNRRCTHPTFFEFPHLLNINRLLTHATIQFHLLHPRPLQKAESLPLADFYSGQQPDNLAASVVDYCSGVLSSNFMLHKSTYQMVN
jgi:hypothetical protein